MAPVSDLLRRHHVQIEGHGSRVLVFSHGFGGDQTLWRRVLPALASDYRVVTFDHIGAGRADPAAYDPARHATLDGYGEDVLALMRALDLGPAVGIGHSAGAMAMACAALADRSVFSHLVMLGASPRYLNDPPAYHGGFDAADIDEMLDLMDQNFQQFIGAMAPLAMNAPDRPDLARELGNSFGRMDPAIARRWARAIFRSDYRQPLQRLAVPAVALQCHDDAIVPMAVGEWLAAHVPDCELRVLQATGHFPHMSQPAEVIGAIRSWLRSRGL